MGDKVMLLMYLKKMFSFLDQGHNGLSIEDSICMKFGKPIKMFALGIKVSVSGGRLGVMKKDYFLVNI